MARALRNFVNSARIAQLKGMPFDIAVRKGKYRELRLAFPEKVLSRVHFLELRAQSFYARDMSKARELRASLTAKADKTATAARNKALAAIETLRALGAPVPAELLAVVNCDLTAARELIQCIAAEFDTPETARW